MENGTQIKIILQDMEDTELIKWEFTAQHQLIIENVFLGKFDVYISKQECRLLLKEIITVRVQPDIYLNRKCTSVNMSFAV